MGSKSSKNTIFDYEKNDLQNVIIRGYNNITDNTKCMDKIVLEKFLIDKQINIELGIPFVLDDYKFNINTVARNTFSIGGNGDTGNTGDTGEYILSV